MEVERRTGGEASRAARRWTSWRVEEVLRKLGFIGSGGFERFFSTIKSIYNKGEDEEAMKEVSLLCRGFEMAGC